MDFRHQQSGEDTSSPIIDLNATLRAELKSAGRDYFDVVAFTHADLDHICGFSNFFELSGLREVPGRRPYQGKRAVGARRCVDRAGHTRAEAG